MFGAPKRVFIFPKSVFSLPKRLFTPPKCVFGGPKRKVWFRLAVLRMAQSAGGYGGSFLETLTMPAHRTTLRKIKDVLRLKWTCNLSHRQVSGALGVGLGTITQYLQLAASAGLDWATIEPLSEAELEQLLVNGSVPTTAAGKRIEPDCAWVHRELRRKGVTLQLLWEEYVAANPGQKTLRYTQFCQRYKDWAQTLKRSMPQQHYAGEKLFADYAGQTVPILDRTGGIAFKAHIFVAVLGASNYTYACATRSEATPDSIGGLIDAMEFYGGVPRKSPGGDFCVNQQVLVMRRSAGEPAPLLKYCRRFLHIMRGVKVNPATQADHRRVSIAAVAFSSRSVRDARVPHAS